MVRGQSQVDVTVGIHPQSVGVADLPAGEYPSVAIANADKRWRSVGLLLADVKHAILVPGDIVWPAHASPHADELSVSRENLHASVGAVAHVDLPIRCDHDAVRQVELAGCGLAWLAPGVDELAVARKAVHPGVAVAIGDVEITGGARHELGGIVKGPSRPRHQVAGLFTASVRMHATLPDHLQGLAIQGEGHSDGVRPIGDIDDVVDNGHPVRVGDGTDPPAVEIIALAVEDHDWRVLTLKDIDAILGIRRHGADYP